LGLPSVDLVNDLEANAHGICMLAPEDVVVLHPDAADARGNRALISAGTGLGEAGLLAEQDGYRPYPSEGGHCDFAPRNDTEIHLLQHLMGLFGLHAFLCSGGQMLNETYRGRVELVGR